ncbi:hypothetical protein K0M31_001928 [Melipona bicolor]|uniref:Uncharacterized protein n=1 Tax=Melipona bicolor TaxID=60889 RepID=A0AA40KYC8_9HYME|nr:hypothetical protein K0M31_001928 [Melipona bicolor]
MAAEEVIHFQAEWCWLYTLISSTALISCPATKSEKLCTVTGGKIPLSFARNQKRRTNDAGCRSLRHENQSHGEALQV